MTFIAGKTTMNQAELKQQVELLADEAVKSNFADLRRSYEGVIEKLSTENRALKADLMTIMAQREQSVRNAATGIGSITPPVTLSKEEYAELLPAKLDTMTFQEVVYADVALKGCNVDNEAEFLAYLGASDEAIAKARSRS